MGIAGKRGFEPHKKGGPGSAGRPTIVGHLDQPFVGGSNATLANASRRTADHPSATLQAAFTALPHHSGVLWSACNAVWSAWRPVWSAWIPVEIGGK
jgi:hypothetical protein